MVGEERTERSFIYLDNNATTKVAPEVVEAMLPFLTELWGNPSSVYRFGREVGKHIEAAREKVAALINATPEEVIFTSCGTESNNSAIESALRTNPDKRHVITTAVEHSANINFCKALRKQGYEVTFLPVEADGSIDLHLLEETIRPDTAIVSVMTANNETGVIFPIAEVAALCRSLGVPCHTDAVQAPGKIPIDVRATGVDFLSLSAHKLHAPKGIGALFIKRNTPYAPYVIGGHQEKGRRGGTENVANMVAFGKAAELALQNQPEENRRVRALRDQIEHHLLTTIPYSSRNGAREPRLPTTTNLSFEGVEAETLLFQLDQLGICVSSGSACTSGSVKPSHVLTAMDVPLERARSSIRLSLGIDNTQADVDYLLQHLPRLVAELRSANPQWEEHLRHKPIRLDTTTKHEDRHSVALPTHRN